MPDATPQETLSLSTVVLMLGVSVLFAGLVHLKAGRRILLHQEASSVCEPETSEDPGMALTAAGLARVRQFHWSLAAFCLTWTPFLVFVTGSLGCELARQVGWQMAPWLILVDLALVLWSWLIARRIRHRLLRRVLLGSEPAEQETGSA